MSKMKDAIKKPAQKFTLELPNVGLGTMRTSATYIALLLQFESSRATRLDVINSVMEIMGLHPEELIHFKKSPDCVDEQKYQTWHKEWKDLKKKLGVPE